MQQDQREPRSLGQTWHPAGMPKSKFPRSMALALLGALTGICSTPLSGAGTAPDPPLHYGPEFFERNLMDPASLAVATNHFVEMGEERAIEELLQEDKAIEASKPGKLYRLFWICRVIFQGRDAPVSPPMLGALDTLPEQRMKLRDWPELPVAESQGVYFLLSESYSLGGRAENFSAFLTRCRKEGKFRSVPVKVPTRADAEAALTALTQEARWKALTGQGPGKPDIALCIPFLREQVAAVPG